MSKKRFTFTLDEIIEHCYKVSKKKTGISEKCAAVHLQLAKWLKELKALRQEKDGTTEDSGWSLVPPNYRADCSFCCHNEGCRCVSPNGPYKTDATTCLAFKDKRLMPKI